MKTNRTVLILSTFLIVNGLHSQSFEEYQKREQKKMQDAAQHEQEGVSSLQKEYTDFVAKRDKEWSDFLRKDWERFQVFSGKKRAEKPKPQTTPVYLPPTKPIAQKPTAKPPTVEIKPTEKPIVVTPVPTPQPRPVEPICKPVEQLPSGPAVLLSFYGRSLSVSYPPAIMQCGVNNVSQAAIATYWEQASATNYTPTVERLMQLKTELSLNDYGYFQLVQQFSNQIYTSSINNARLLSWFVMVRSGYGVRVAYQGSEIALLVPSAQQIYQRSFLTLNGTNYYVFPKLNGSSYSTYDKDYATTTKSVDFHIMQPIRFQSRKAVRNVPFVFDGKSYNVNLEYDPDLMTYYKDYPLVDLEVYFGAAVSMQAKASIAQALKPIVANMDQGKALNLILHFVQTGFAYKTDQDQFGYEKFFFVEETLYYPYCDCEDRAVLFSYLVKELLGLKVVGLEYPDHVSTAVCVPSIQSGDYLKYGNAIYVVADPTYINASVGMSMPQYRNVSPIVIDAK